MHEGFSMNSPLAGLPQLYGINPTFGGHAEAGCPNLDAPRTHLGGDSVFTVPVRG